MIYNMYNTNTQDLTRPYPININNAAKSVAYILQKDTSFPKPHRMILILVIVQ